MTKFLVHVYGKIPDEIEVEEARDREEAEELALLLICERITLKATRFPDPVAEEKGGTT